MGLLGLFQKFGKLGNNSKFTKILTKNRFFSYSKQMQRIIQFVKKEIVLCIALFLGLVSLLICRPSGEIIAKSIDLRVLSLLFCLMHVIQGFASINLLDKLANKMLGLCKNSIEKKTIIACISYVENYILFNNNFI
mgnify:CR=1 FL=1